MNAARERAKRHGYFLQEIVRLLLPLQATERVLPSVVATLANALPTSTVVLVAEEERKPRTQLWCSPAVNSHWARDATTHARALYALLVGQNQAQVRALQKEPATSLHTLPALKVVANQKGYVTLPLAVCSIFGALEVIGVLQVQGVGPIDLVDLRLIGAVTTLLAPALYSQQASDWRRHASRVRHSKPN